MRPIAYILSAILAAGILTSAAVFFFSEDDLQDAIENFEDQNYESSLKTFKKLIPLADNKELEKIFYFRTRAANRLAESLNDDFSEELSQLTVSAAGTKKYKKAFDEINESISKTNKKLGTDLTIVPGINGGRISSGSLFYGEFTSRFRGSPYLEDLDFEELEKNIILNPGNSVQSILRFYNSHHGTPYITHLIKMIFDSLQSGSSSTAGCETQLTEFLKNFSSRYPSNPYTIMIKTCSGDRVNLRNSPQSGGTIVGHINIGDILLQLEKSMDSTQIGDTRDYWYRVSSLNGISGWIFGKFLGQYTIPEHVESEADEVWVLNETFTNWSDSNTPENWKHIEGSDVKSIGFTAFNNNKTATIKSSPASISGLYTVYNTARLFTVESRARLNSGSSLTLFAYVTAYKNGYYLKISSNSIEICGITIPLNTSEWHTFRLENTDGESAQLLIDGKIAAGLIKQKHLNEQYKDRGIYLLCTEKGAQVNAETSYIKSK